MDAQNFLRSRCADKGLVGTVFNCGGCWGGQSYECNFAGVVFGLGQLIDPECLFSCEEMA